MRVQRGRRLGRGLWVTAIILGLLGITASASAGVLAPGETLYNPSVTSTVPIFVPSYTVGGLPANYSVALQATPYISNWSGGTLTGTVASQVFQDPATGYLAFVYRFTNTTPDDTVEAATIGNVGTCPWCGVEILGAGADTSGDSTPLGIISWATGEPYNLQLSPNGSALRIRWEGATYLQTGEYSSLIWVATDATEFALTKVAVLDSGDAGFGLAFAPISVPEPATWTVLGLGIGMVGLIRRRRRS